MSNLVQNAIVLLAVAAAGVYLAYRAWRVFGGKASGCGGCGSCSHAKSEQGAEPQGFVPLDSLNNPGRQR